MYIVKVSKQLCFKDKESYEKYAEDVENEVIDKLNINNQLIDCAGTSIETVDRTTDEGDLENIKEKKGTTLNYITTKRSTLKVGDLLIIEGWKYMVVNRNSVYFIVPIDNDFKLLSDCDCHSLEELKDKLIEMKLNYSTQANV